MVYQWHTGPRCHIRHIPDVPKGITRMLQPHKIMEDSENGMEKQMSL
jgi:hypothetical protein